ncbi:MAG: hypothetical protein ACP5IJ_01920, partial [Candidatus Nanoarchaeia archaeon]
GAPATVIGLRAILFLILAVIFVTLLLKIFKREEERIAAGILAILMAILAVRFIPDNPLIYLGSMLGTSISIGAILLVPAGTLYFVWQQVKDKNTKWRDIGITCISMSVLIFGSLYYFVTRAGGKTTTVLEELPMPIPSGGTALIATLTAVFLFIVGAVLTFKKTRIGAFMRISSTAKAEGLKEAHTAIKDVWYESKIARQNIKSINELINMLQSKGNKYIASGDIDNNIKEKTNKIIQEIKLDERITEGCISVLRDELDRLKKTMPARIQQEIDDALLIEQQNLVKESNVFKDLKIVMNFLSNPTAPMYKSFVLGTLESARKFLYAEEKLLTKVGQILKMIEEEIENEQTL